MHTDTILRIGNYELESPLLNAGDLKLVQGQ